MQANCKGVFPSTAWALTLILLALALLNRTSTTWVCPGAMVSQLPTIITLHQFHQDQTTTVSSTTTSTTTPTTTSLTIFLSTIEYLLLSRMFQRERMMCLQILILWDPATIVNNFLQLYLPLTSIRTKAVPFLQLHKFHQEPRSSGLHLIRPTQILRFWSTVLCQPAAFI